MSKFFLSIDTSSSACKAALINKSGKIVNLVQVELPLISLKKSGFEYDPEELWRLQESAILELLKDVNPKDIISIGISNQRETVVAGDRNTGKPVYNAISGQDRRNEEFLEKYADTEEYIREKTGLNLDLYFSASKIDWILKSCSYDLKNLCIGTIDSGLLWKLTNGRTFATEPSNASRTMIFNLDTLEGATDLMELFEFPPHIFPKILSSADDFGYGEYKDTKIEISGILGDQQSSLLGCGAMDEGEAKCTYGTGAFLLFNSGNSRKVESEMLLQTVAGKIGEEVVYAAEGACFACGNSVNGAKNNGYFEEFSELPPSKFHPVFFCQS